MSDFDSAPTEMLEMPMATGEVTEEYFNHVRKINDVYYDQIKISDQKPTYSPSCWLSWFHLPKGEAYLI